MAQPYTDLVGPPPDPRTFAFLDWVDRLIAARIAYCARTRTSVYYFAQGGSDAGAGTQASPFKTKAKAQSVINASAGDVAVLFKRGDVWAEFATLTDSGKPNVTIGAWGPPQAAKPVFDGNSAGTPTDLDGVQIYGDGSVVQGICSQNWGQNNTNQQYPIKLGHTGADAGLVIDCEGYNGGRHVIAHFARNGGGAGGSGTGGIATVVACRAGGTIDPTGTTYNFYADHGGMEYLVAGCEVTSLPPAGTGCYSHTAGAAAIALGVVQGLHLLPACQGLPVTAGATPAAAAIGDCRMFEVDTLQEYPASGRNAVNVTGINNAVRVNGVYRLHADLSGPSRAFGTATGNSWCLNSTYDVDLAGNSSDHGGAYNAAQGVGLYRWDHCRLHVRNAPGPFGMEFNATYNPNQQTTSAGAEIANSVFTSESGGGNVYLATGNPAFIALRNNAYFGVAADAVAYASDAAAHPLDVFPPLDASPHPGSGLYQASAPPADGVPLEYDARRQPRNPAGQHLGPVETVTRNQLIAGQLAMLRVDANLVTALAGNAVAVDHDAGGSDALRYVAPDGSGIDAAAVRAYLQSDYAAGRYTVRARAATGPDGRWLAPMYLPAGQAYTLLFEKPGDYGPDVKTVTL